MEKAIIVKIVLPESATEEQMKIIGDFASNKINEALKPVIEQMEKSIGDAVPYKSSKYDFVAGTGSAKEPKGFIQ